MFSKNESLVTKIIEIKKKREKIWKIKAQNQFAEMFNYFFKLIKNKKLKQIEYLNILRQIEIITKIFNKRELLSKNPLNI